MKNLIQTKNLWKYRRIKTFSKMTRWRYYYTWWFEWKEMNDPRVQAMFKRSRHNNLSIFIFSQDCYELRKKMIRASGNIYHIFEPNNFLDVRNIYQDKASMDRTLDEFKYLTSTCWNEQYQPLTTDRTEDKFSGRYRLGFNSMFIPDSSPF